MMAVIFGTNAINSLFPINFPLNWFPPHQDESITIQEIEITSVLIHKRIFVIILNLNQVPCGKFSNGGLCV